MNLISFLPLLNSNLEYMIKYIVFTMPFIAIGILIVFSSKFRNRFLLVALKLNCLYILSSLAYIIYITLFKTNINDSLPGFSYGDAAWYFLVIYILYTYIFVFENKLIESKILFFSTYGLVTTAIVFAGLRTALFTLIYVLLLSFITILIFKFLRTKRHFQLLAVISLFSIFVIITAGVLAPETSRVNVFKTNLIYEFNKYGGNKNVEANIEELNESESMALKKIIDSNDSNTEIKRIGNSKYLLNNGLNYYAGLIKIEEDFYYVNKNGKFIENDSVFVRKNNNLLPKGEYYFNEEGKIVFANAKEKDQLILEQISNNISDQDVSEYQLSSLIVFDPINKKYDTLSNVYGYHIVNSDRTKEETEAILNKDIEEKNYKYIIVPEKYRDDLINYESNHDRVTLWRFALKEFSENRLFGNGPFSFQSKYTDTYPHNILLELLVDYGIIGTLIIALIVIFMLYRSYKFINLCKDKEILISLLLGLSYALAFALYTSLYNNNELTYLLTVLVSISISSFKLDLSK